MSQLSLADSLSAGPCAAAARAACERYRTVLGVVLILETGAGLALLLAPQSVARLLLGAASGPAGITRLAGLLLLFLVALLFAARAWPARAKIANALGVIGRGAVALLLLAGGGRLPLAGAAEGLAAILLGILYYRYFVAEVMSRP
jgi:hypothetical protein